MFDKADRVGDVIERKSFNLSGKLPLLFGHDQNQPIGVWDSIVESDKGLEVIPLQDSARSLIQIFPMI